MSKKKRIILIISIAVISLVLLQLVGNFIMGAINDNSASKKYEYGSVDWAIERWSNGSIKESEKTQYDTIGDYYVGMIYNRKLQSTPLGDKIYAESIAGVKIDDKFTQITNWSNTFFNVGFDSEDDYLSSLSIYVGDNSVLVVADTEIGSVLNTNTEYTIEGDVDVEDSQGNKYNVIKNDATQYRVYYMVYDKMDFLSDLKLYYSFNGDKTIQFDLSAK